MADVDPTLKNYVDACVPLVWIDTHEEDRVVSDVLPEVFAHFKVPVTVFEWFPDMDDSVKYTATLGNTGKGSSIHAKLSGVNSKTLMSWLSQAGEYSPEQLSKYPVVLVIYQPDIAASQLTHDGIFQHSYMYPTLAQVAKKFRFCDSYIFLVGSSCHVPDTLKDILAHVRLPLPSHKELREYIKDLLNAYKKNAKIKLPLKKEDVQRLLDDAANAAQGMTLLATENAVSLSLAMHSTLDVPTIFRAKTQLLASSDVLNLVSPDDSVKTLAGFDNYISWLTIRRNIYSQKARDFKLPNPKGVLLVGLPGVGKSTAVKVAASYLNLPLLHLDIGKLYRRMLGESEQAFRLACAVAEAVSPCVSADTLIKLADGSLRSALELYESGQRGLLASMDVISGMRTTTVLKGITKKASDLHGMFLVKTCGGDIERTGNHRVFTKRGWLHVNELRPNHDFIAFDCTRPSNIPYGETVSADVYLPKGLRFVEGNWRLGKGGFQDAIIPKLPKIVDERSLYLLGLSMADGSFGSRNIYWRSSNNELLSYISDVLYDLFGCSPKKYNNACIGHVAYKKDGYAIRNTKQSHELRHRKIVALFFKELSNNLTALSLNLQAAWLRGFVEGDGCVLSETNRLVITQTRPKLRRVISAVLRNLGHLRAFHTKCLTICGYANFNHIHTVLAATDGFSRDKIARSSSGIPSKWVFTRNIEIDTEHHISWARVVSIKELPPQDVYDLHCSPDMPVYIGDGVVDHNCILWVDELEKAMAAGGADTDGGASQRILAALLHWRQETKHPIFFIATANDVEALPPPMYRRGRFDAIFAVGLPDEHTRIEIFHIHCAKFGRSLTFTKAQEKFLKEKTQYFSGAEIQSVVSDAMFIAFDADTDLAFEHIAQALKDVYPLNVPGSASVEVFEKWVSSNKVSMVS